MLHHVFYVSALRCNGFASPVFLKHRILVIPNAYRLVLFISLLFVPSVVCSVVFCPWKVLLVTSCRMCVFFIVSLPLFLCPPLFDISVLLSCFFLLHQQDHCQGNASHVSVKIIYFHSYTCLGFSFAIVCRMLCEPEQYQQFATIDTWALL